MISYESYQTARRQGAAQVTGFALAVCASVLVMPASATARSFVAASGVILTVSRTSETAVSFTTRPSASCLIGAGARAPMPLPADSAGTVRFYARTSPDAAPVIPLIAACSEGRLQWTVALRVQSVFGNVQNAIPPPVADRSFALPRGFDPATATDRELTRLGFPSAPDRISSPDLYRDWLRTVTLGIRVAPGGVATDQYAKAPLQTENWSGILAHGAPRQYIDVEGNWPVPRVTAPSKDSPASSVMWVGIDGADKAKGLYQTGTGQSVFYTSGVMMTDYYGWYEVVPGYAITRFKNFVVGPGDKMSALAADCSSSSQVTACFGLVDMSRNETAIASLKSSGPFTNGCAEWIMERPTTKHGLLPLPDYGTFESSNMLVYDTLAGAWTKYGVESHDRIYMYNNGDLLSTAGGTVNLEGAKFVWVNYL